MSSHALAQLQPGHPRRTGAQSREVARRALERSLLYSEELGIDLSERSDPMYFRWFLASLLFGAQISETIAKNTYRSFIKHGLTSPKRVLDAGWDFLVYPVMREGGYVRYDGRKSTQVLRDCERLIADYGGSLSRLQDGARDARELEDRLLSFYRRRTCHREHLPARAASVLGQGRSRPVARGEETGQRSLDRS